MHQYFAGPIQFCRPNDQSSLCEGFNSAILIGSLITLIVLALVAFFIFRTISKERKILRTILLVMSLAAAIGSLLLTPAALNSFSQTKEYASKEKAERSSKEKAVLAHLDKEGAKYYLPENLSIIRNIRVAEGEQFTMMGYMELGSDIYTIDEKLGEHPPTYLTRDYEKLTDTNGFSTYLFSEGPPTNIHEFYLYNGIISVKINYSGVPGSFSMSDGIALINSLRPAKAEELKTLYLK